MHDTTVPPQSFAGTSTHTTTHAECRIRCVTHTSPILPEGGRELVASSVPDIRTFGPPRRSNRKDGLDLVPTPWRRAGGAVVGGAPVEAVLQRGRYKPVTEVPAPTHPL